MAYVVGGSEVLPKMWAEYDIMKFCAEIQSTTSTTEKKAILKRWKNNDIILEFLQFLLDKTVVTGISKAKINKTLANYPTVTGDCRTIIDIIRYLKTHNTGSDVDIAVCQVYLASITGFYKEEFNGGNSLEDTIQFNELLKKIIIKTLKLGIDTKLANTAIPGLIKVHEVQQANKLQDTKLKDGEWICLSEKLNGNRATYINGKIVSRQGREFTNVDHIVKDLNRIRSLFDVNMVFDGEIIRKNVDGIPDNENFRIGTGLLNSDEEDKTALSFVIFDLLPYSEFTQGESKLTYSERLKTMQQVLDYAAKVGLEHVDVVDFLYSGTDHTMIEKCLADMDAAGKEGCMLARDVTYKCKRHSGLLKVKTFYTMDLKIIGFEEGNGKNEGTLGSIVVDYKGNRVGVGGFTDALRTEIWNNQDKYLGRIAEVKYKEITKDKSTGKESLQFPTFVQFREIGKEVSYA